MESIKQGFFKTRGAVLRRVESREGDLSLYLLLEKTGPIWVAAPGAAKGKRRFGGAAEPLIFGIYSLYSGRNRLYLKDIDVKEDFWTLRKKPLHLRGGLALAKLIVDYLPPNHPCNELLSLFFWALRSLEEGASPDIVEWRFLWRWLKYWGIAPDFDRCAKCGAPLEDARWGGEGFYCSNSNCSEPGTGISFSGTALQEVRMAAILSRRAFVKWTTQEEPRFSKWNELNEKLVYLLEKERS